MLDMRDRDGARRFAPSAESTSRPHSGRAAADSMPLLGGPMAQQRVRHLDQAAGAVADQRVGADRAAMVEIDQDLQARGG